MSCLSFHTPSYVHRISNKKVTKRDKKKQKQKQKWDDLLAIQTQVQTMVRKPHLTIKFSNRGSAIHG